VKGKHVLFYFLSGVPTGCRRLALVIFSHSPYLLQQQDMKLLVMNKVKKKVTVSNAKVHKIALNCILRLHHLIT